MVLMQKNINLIANKCNQIDYQPR